jgi:hypothetical protein
MPSILLLLHGWNGAGMELCVLQCFCEAFDDVNAESSSTTWSALSYDHRCLRRPFLHFRGLSSPSRFQHTLTPGLVLQALSIGVYGENGFGIYSSGLHQPANSTNPHRLNESPDAVLALYNLFGLMTTVNHPDVMMWLVDARPATMVVIMSFMFMCSIIANNLLLGVVYADYCDILDEKLKEEANLRSKMLDRAYDIITATSNGAQSMGIEMEIMVEVLREIDGLKVASTANSRNAHSFSTMCFE